MGEIFRSEEMQMIQLFIQDEGAHDAFDELGELGVIQFKDLNPEVNAFQRRFVAEVKRIGEMERQVRFFEDQVRSLDGDEEVDPVTLGYSDGLNERVTSSEISDLENTFEELEHELLQLNSNQEMLRQDLTKLRELKYVLTADNEFFAQAGEISTVEEAEIWEGGDSMQVFPTVKLGFITGILPTAKMLPFGRVLWRATRGNIFMKQTEIEEPIIDQKTDDPVKKSVFIVFYQGLKAEDKVRRICEAFSANIYPCPESSNERRELLGQVEIRLEEEEQVFKRMINYKQRVLRKMAPNLERWKVKVTKEKAIYHIMNLCNSDPTRKCLIAEGWTPKLATDSIQAALKRANARSDVLAPSILNFIKSREEPPTYFRTNKFTSSFQAIVDAYGMARYREINPGVFTIITFPFLFALMFGDLGHGTLLLLFAIYLVVKENDLARIKLNEIVATCFEGRYVLLLMGIFSVFTGAIYNECFAVPLDIFGTRWYFQNNELFARWNPSYQTAYWFGVDPAWKGAKNELTYYNSLKMKLSIIFGIAQMCFGIFLSLLNGLHFKKPYNVYFEFIPQICFMLAIFGYMCFLIFLKWCIDWEAIGKQAPYLLGLMIEMFLTPHRISDKFQIFTGQLEVQICLLLIAVISVPMMLLPKPLLLRRDHQQGYKPLPDKPLEEEEGINYDPDEHEEFDFSEVMIHQVIHTIEFVLGAISNTASYLRLWALSLAHSELATVFWERVLVLTFGFSAHYTFIPAFVGFAVWAAMTFCVLLVMESLSAFLHALRLHWVEFQNKFYMGDGHKFKPFCFATILRGEEE